MRRPCGALAAAAVVLGCSSTPVAGVSGGPPPREHVGCAATAEDTNATACEDEGLGCTLEIACEVSLEDVHCLCHDGSWRCHDPVGAMEPGSAARCINPGSSSSATPCPPSFAAADGSGCEPIQRACFYEGELCADGVTKLDYCICERNASAGTAYSCFPVPCSPPME